MSELSGYKLETLRQNRELTLYRARQPGNPPIVAQIVIGGTRRLTPEGVLSMPSFGHAYSDDEIAAVANYVTARFGAKAHRSRHGMLPTCEHRCRTRLGSLFAAKYAPRFFDDWPNLAVRRNWCGT
jgi:hypothetical protein